HHVGYLLTPCQELFPSFLRLILQFYSFKIPSQLLCLAKIFIGVPVYPKASRIRFSINRLKVKCINSGLFTNTTNVGGLTETCVVYSTLSFFPLIVGVGFIASASEITSFNTFVGIRFVCLSLTNFIIGIRRRSRFFVLAHKKIIVAWSRN